METSTFIGSPKIKISVVKAAKGYRWAVEVTHETATEAITELIKCEEAIADKYGEEANP
jgi:hypothetical protein